MDKILIYTNGFKDVYVGSWDLTSCYATSRSIAQPLPADFKYKRTLRRDSDYAKRLFSHAPFAAATPANVDDSTITSSTTAPVPPPTRVSIDTIHGMELFLDVPTTTYVVVKNGVEFPATVEGFASIVSELDKVNKLTVPFTAAITSASSSVRMGSRILLWGPTGSGKTMSFHSESKKLKSEGKLDYVEKITISEGFEEQDFLTYILPDPKLGIRYVEREIISILREASNGKKVAICLDEINRGSRSFLNFILTFLDGVDGQNYVLNNHIKDEKIIIPMENVLIYATMNLGSKYSGTSALDEALMDRFTQVKFLDYNLDNEKAISDAAFGDLSEAATQIVSYVRGLAQDGEIRSAISTRGLKTWAESFINTLKTKADFYSTFSDTLLYRIVNVDDYGNPSSQEILTLMKKFKELGIC